MPTRRRGVNRGPAAAAENRRAILSAARDLFAKRGYRVPLNAIASAAGVGQGVLYRHFPTRLDLAFTVFEAHFAELEAIAAEPDPRSFTRLWSRMLDLTISESAFVEMVVDARRSLAGYEGEHRLRALIESTLPAARQAGFVDAATTPDDVLLWWRMAFGIVVTAPDPKDAGLRALVDRALGPVTGTPPVAGEET